MNTALTRKQVFDLIDDERDYQDAHAAGWNHRGSPAVEAELLMLEHYITLARQEWVRTSDPAPVLDVLRKIAGIATRALENHGKGAGPDGPKRNI